MSDYRRAKKGKGIAICPFFSWQSENIEGLGHSENDISLTFCTHGKNLSGCEGNCQEDLCPLLK